jgi:isoamylase
MGARRLQQGDSSALGSSCVDGGVNFAVYSERASALELCLFDQTDRESARLPLPARTGDVWHGFLPDAGPGLRYGFRAYGAFDPDNGLFFDPARVMIDPYAKRLSGAYIQHPAHFVQAAGIPSLDNAAYVPKSVVTEPVVGSNRVNPSVRHSMPLIYEAHVRGLTRLCESIPEAVRGTYAGLAHPFLITHLKRLGVSVVELMPVQYHIDEPHLTALGLTNYWGYNPLAFMATHNAYASCASGAVAELAAAVRAFHDAGIEVVLDVVFNHSAEGGAQGPILSMRGLDNLTYYRFDPQPGTGGFIDVTGCGNTLNFAHPVVSRLVLDSLRYWVQVLDVDGFRFDLAVALGRHGDHFSARNGLLEQISNDPVLSGRRLIAEPWDVGPNGYQLGAFAAPWREWNDRFRDTVRAYWRGDPGAQADLGRRLHGSNELFEHDGRTPAGGINFVTAHDGFVLEDLVSYHDKHNLANGEDNRDGHAHNLSDNMGHEGASTDPVLRAKRDRRKRAMLATLFLAQGTPMLLGGDEFGNSQQGNNNAYCQDGPLGWLQWNTEHALVAYIARLSELRASSNPIWRLKFVHKPWRSEEMPSPDGGHSTGALPDASIAWRRADGSEMVEADWHAPDCPFSLLRADNTVLEMCCFNRSSETVAFQLPLPERRWEGRLDSSTADGVPELNLDNGCVLVGPQAVVVVHSRIEAALTSRTE